MYIPLYPTHIPLSQHFSCSYHLFPWNRKWTRQDASCTGADARACGTGAPSRQWLPRKWWVTPQWTAPWMWKIHENPWKSTISIDSNGFHRENARFFVILSIVLRKPSPHRYNVGDRLSTAFHGALGFSAQRYPVRIFAIRPYALVISSITGSFPWCVDFPEKNETSMARMGISWPVVMTPEVGFPSGYRRGYSVRWHEHDQAWVNSINFSSIAHVCQWAMKTTFDWLMQGIILATNQPWDSGILHGSNVLIIWIIIVFYIDPNWKSLFTHIFPW